MKTPLLSVENLTVEFREKSGNTIRALNNISLTIGHGEIFGLIGESGAGKTVLAHSILGLLEGYPGIINGKIIFDGNNLLEGIPSLNGDKETMSGRKKHGKWLKEHQRRMKGIRGIKIGMVFQEPFKSMDPLFTVREHIMESIKNTNTFTKDKEIGSLVIDWLKSVQLDNPENVQNQYVFELSGGMIQRVMISIAFASQPVLIIADEPTTSLDTVTQKKILDLIKQKSRKLGQSLFFITHDLGIAARYFDRIAVILGGRIIEIGSLEDVIQRKECHPYTLELYNAAVGPAYGVSGQLMNVISHKISGCIFAERCTERQETCSEKEPPMLEVGKDHFVRCWKYYST